KRGERPKPGSTIGRLNSAPEGGPLVLKDVPGAGE
ncbi:MAG: NAD(P)H-dependent oxidoreductase subunit E, partial [Proteobacteria bacterium]|nr:NAD(P)H-dependent oxidoreductase subunit E [Pseudomonadota bacterium]